MNLNNMNNPNNINFRDESYGSEKNWRIGTTDLKEVKEAYTVGTPTQSNGGANYITSRDLNDPEEMYQVGTASFAQGGTTIISTKSADTRNSDTNLNVDNSEINQSAKYKYPNVRQNTSQMPKESGGYDEPSI